MDSMISLKGVNKIYGTDVKTQVLDDINLEIAPKSFNAIIGASGSGKSTLLNIIGTLDRPTTGDIFISGIKTSKMSKNALAALRNETIGFVFQFHYLLPEFTAYENVLLPWQIKNGKVTPEIRKRALELMDLMGLSKVANNNATKMSGGQQQRTAIARSLINSPKIILADEPTGNLDSESTESVYDILRDINENYNTTFLIITHDRRIAQKTDRIIEIQDGKISLDVVNLAPKKGSAQPLTA
ncbi:MAG: ABC transporter ATP-binding protein [Clostridiales bacterium]|nr:ABC transporter ATP-binding protein [Clostridiales bacterium]